MARGGSISNTNQLDFICIFIYMNIHEAIYDNPSRGTPHEIQDRLHARRDRYERGHSWIYGGVRGEGQKSEVDSASERKAIGRIEQTRKPLARLTRPNPAS